MQADLEPEKQSSDVAVPEAAKPQESEVDKAKKRAERYEGQLSHQAGISEYWDLLPDVFARLQVWHRIC